MRAVHEPTADATEWTSNAAIDVHPKHRFTPLEVLGADVCDNAQPAKDPFLRWQPRKLSRRRAYQCPPLFATHYTQQATLAMLDSSRKMQIPCAAAIGPTWG